MIHIDDFKNRKTIWVASTGRVPPETSFEWIGYMFPTEMEILNFDEMDIYVAVPYVCDHYITFNIDGLKGTFKANVDSEGYLEFKYDPCFGLDKESVENWFIADSKRILKSQWNGTNNIKHKDVFKGFLLKNHYEYFSKNYPELLI